MVCLLYAGLKKCSQLETTTCRICLIPRHPNYEFGDGTEEYFHYLYGAYPWAFIQCNEAKCHQRTVSGQWGGGVSHPVSQIGNDYYKII